MNSSNNKQDDVSSANGFLPATDWNFVSGELMSASNIMGGPDGTSDQLGRLLSLMTYMTIHRDVSSGPNQLRIDINLNPTISLQDGASFKFVASRDYNANPSCIVGTNSERPLITPSGDAIEEDVIREGGLYMLYYKQSLGKFVVYGLANYAGGADVPTWRGYF